MDQWDNISRAGAHAALDRNMSRKVILCNQIAVSIGLALSVGAFIQWMLGYTLLAPYMLVFAGLYFLVPCGNALGYINISRLYLNVLPPLLILLLSGLILYRDPSFKFALIPVILVPILLFGIAEWAKMLLGIAWVVIAFLLMDVLTPMIPKLQGVTVGNSEIAMNANVNGLIAFFMFSASFVYFQRLNQKAERELCETLRQVQAQKEVIERQQKEEQGQAALALAQQREVNALKSTFVAMTSHEFRNPLAAIHSSQELLRDFGERLPASECNELFEIMDASVRRMTAMLDKILIIGRADANLLEFSPAVLNIAALCRQLVEETLQSAQAMKAGTATIRLQLDLANDELAYADENLLRHCLGNLLSNAIKYSPNGGEAVLSVGRRSHTLVFEITDQGIGIPDEDLPRLFDAFHRARNVGAIPGTGLGLAIVKQSVERHGGTIDVASAMVGASESDCTHGTRFSIAFPQP